MTPASGSGTADRYLPEGIDVLAAQAPDLHAALERGKRLGWSHVTGDGMLIAGNRVAARTEADHHLWYSGKHRHHGGNIHLLADPAGFPIWTCPVEPGSVHDLTAARTHALPALYPHAVRGLPVLADTGYQGAGIGIHHPTKGCHLDPDTTTRNTLLTVLRAQGERANALLQTRWTALRRITLY